VARKKIMEKIYDTLVDDSKNTVDGIVKLAMKELSNDGKTDLVLLLAVLEKLNDNKKEIKKAIEDKKRDAEKALVKERELLGKAYAETLKVGDMITFRYGNGGKQTATLPLDKIGLKTIQVTYTPDMLPEGSATAKRNILFSKIVVPEGFTLNNVA